jgi:Xaa-Pro dipeptidase
MTSRRDFLKAGAIAGAALAAPELGWTQESDVPPLTGPLPASIAKLTSMRAQARPITNDERRQRLERARELMQRNHLDAILVMSGTSLMYYTGIRWSGGERMFAMVLPAKGDVFFVCPAFEEGRGREQIERGPFAKNTDVRTWQEDDSPYQRVAQGLKDRGISTGTVGMEETVRYVFSSGVAQASPQLKIASATPVTAGCRQIKSAHELDLMRLASKVTLLAYAAAWQALKPGMTQLQFGQLVAAAHQRLGFPGGAGVNVAEYSALPHGSATPQVIQENAILLIDGGCNVEGYDSDLSRTFVLGKATDKMKQVFDIVHAAQAAALKQARPGVEAQSVDAAARDLIASKGYGPDYKYFTHRVGHGLGMDGHEWPYLVRGNTLPLEANMTFSDEPGVYIKGEFGVRLEDDMHITEDGAELLTPQSNSLEKPFESVQQ